MFVCRSGAADGGRRRSRLCRGKWCSVCRLAARPRKCRTRSSGRCGRTLFSPYFSEVQTSPKRFPFNCTISSMYLRQPSGAIRIRSSLKVCTNVV